MFLVRMFWFIGGLRRFQLHLYYKFISRRLEHLTMNSCRFLYQYYHNILTEPLAATPHRFTISNHWWVTFLSATVYAAAGSRTYISSRWQWACSDPGVSIHNCCLILQIHAFQQKPRNCSLKQAAVTRILLKKRRFVGSRVAIMVFQFTIVLTFYQCRRSNAKLAGFWERGPVVVNFVTN